MYDFDNAPFSFSLSVGLRITVVDLVVVVLIQVLLVRLKLCMHKVYRNLHCLDARPMMIHISVYNISLKDKQCELR